MGDKFSSRGKQLSVGSADEAPSSKKSKMAVSHPEETKVQPPMLNLAVSQAEPPELSEAENLATEETREVEVLEPPPKGKEVPRKIFPQEATEIV